MKSLPLLLVGNVRAITKAIIAHGRSHPIALLTSASSSVLREGLGAFSVVAAIPPEESTDAWVETALALDRRYHFAAIGAWDERYQWAAANIAEALGIESLSIKTAGLLRDKLELRSFLARNGLSRVTAAAVTGPADIHAFAERTGWPVVLKPRDAAGSSGVTIIRQPDDVGIAWQWVKNGAWVSSLGPMIEQFAGEEELSIDCFTEDGRHVLIGHSSHLKGCDHPLEFGHVAPSTVSRSVLDTAVKYVFACLDALGIQNGITSSEVIVDHEPCLVETHLRPAGGELTTIYGQRTERDLLELLARQVVGDRILPTLLSHDVREDSGDPEVIWFSGPNAAGRLHHIEGLEEARTVPGVTEVMISCQPGDRVGVPRSALDRVMHVRATAKSAAEALNIAQRAAGSVRFIIEVDAYDPNLILPSGLTLQASGGDRC